MFYVRAVTGARLLASQLFHRLNNRTVRLEQHVDDAKHTWLHLNISGTVAAEACVKRSTQ